MSNPTPDKLIPLDVGFRRKEYRKFALIQIFLYLLIVPIFILVIFFLRRSQNDDIAIRKIKKRTTFLVGILPVLLLFLFVFIYHVISRRVGKVIDDDKTELKYYNLYNRTFVRCIDNLKNYKEHDKNDQKLFYFNFFFSSLFFNIFIGLFCTYIIVTFYFLNKYPMETIEFNESVTLEQKEEYYKKFGTNFQLNYYFTFIVVLLFLPSLLRICLRKTQEGVKIKESEKLLQSNLKFFDEKTRECGKKNQLRTQAMLRAFQNE